MKIYMFMYGLIMLMTAACFADVIEIQNPQQFQDIVQNNPLVIADFYAPWCQPCQRMAPFFDAISHENNNVIFVKLNHSNASVKNSIFNQYNVHSFPTLITFKNAQPLQVIHGTKTTVQLRHIVARLLES